VSRSGKKVIVVPVDKTDMINVITELLGTVCNFSWPDCTQTDNIKEISFKASLKRCHKIILSVNLYKIKSVILSVHALWFLKFYAALSGEKKILRFYLLL
jgi:hypothetical protein